MRQRARRMRTISGLSRWFWGSVCGLGLILVGSCLVYFLKPNSSNPPPSQEANFSNEVNSNETALQPNNVEPLVTEINTDSTPTLTLPIGSVEEACRIHELPLWWDVFDDPDLVAETLTTLLNSETCNTALDVHVRAINPYTWGDISKHLQFALFEIDNPLTFDRIFADPVGDFARVQDTTSWTECLSERGSKNFEPKESCNADALMNYALFNRFCYYREIVVHAGQQFGADQTREQSSFMWEQALEGRWVKMKCQEFDPDLKLSEHKHPDLTKLLASLDNPQSLELAMARLQSSRQPELSDPGETYPPSYLIYILIELAAVLGDDAALLTNTPFAERGMQFGPFWGLLSNPAWSNLQKKREPSRERLRQTFELLPIFSRPDLEINWDRLVRHLCEPPFAQPSTQSNQNISEEREEPTEPKSCRAVVNELYIDGDLSELELEFVDRIERIALRLDLYD